MATDELVPRRTIGGVIAVWGAATLAAVVIGLFVPVDWRAAWITVGLGLSLLLAFAIQLLGGRSQGFTERVAASVLGAALMMGVISLGFGIAALIPG